MCFLLMLDQIGKVEQSKAIKLCCNFQARSNSIATLPQAGFNKQ